MNILTVPGVGGSEPTHWQSWLERQVSHSTRVEQDHWKQPVISVWVERFVETLLQQTKPVYVVAHSFGCLTAVAALSKRPDLKQRIIGLLLVAPANPERFSAQGLRQQGENSIADQLQQSALAVPTRLIASRTDPWLSYADAVKWSTRWGATLVDLGDAGHINVAAGFGEWPQIFHHLHGLHQHAIPSKKSFTVFQNNRMQPHMQAAQTSLQTQRFNVSALT
jgi:predicted alpha/beta hydrolase family esterase